MIIVRRRHRGNGGGGGGDKVHSDNGGDNELNSGNGGDGGVMVESSGNGEVVEWRNGVEGGSEPQHNNNRAFALGDTHQSLKKKKEYKGKKGRDTRQKGMEGRKEGIHEGMSKRIEEKQWKEKGWMDNGGNSGRDLPPQGRGKRRKEGTKEKKDLPDIRDIGYNGRYVTDRIPRKGYHGMGIRLGGEGGGRDLPNHEGRKHNHTQVECLGS
jgi:hypothetical protein